MLGLVRIEPVAQPAEPPPRMWLVFFGEADGAWWWTRFLRPGFRHVCAAAWYPGQDRWVYFNPAGRGTVIEVASDTEFGPRFEHLVRTSAAILRVRGAQNRNGHPAAFFCVGAIKALLGVRSCALGPFGLYRHLLVRGAEIVARPEDDLGFSVSRPPAAAGRTDRGPGDRGGTRAAEAARGGGQNPGDAGSVAA